MKKYTFLIILVYAIQVANAQTNHIKNINWLVGNWKMNLPKGSIVESWKRSNDSTLQGKSYFIKLNGDSIHQETVQLIYRNGTTYYIPTVNGQNNNQPVFFKLTSYKNNTLIFENPLHDFPQKIIYTLESENKLNASIEGVSKEKFKKENYLMDRIKSINF